MLVQCSAESFLYWINRGDLMENDLFDVNRFRLTEEDKAHFFAAQGSYKHATDCCLTQNDGEGECDCGLDEVLAEEARAEAPLEVET